MFPSSSPPQGWGGRGGHRVGEAQELSPQPITHLLPNPLPPWRGIPASPGIAIGPVVLYQPAVPEVREQLLDNPQRAWQQLQVALNTAREQIQSLRQNVTACGQQEAAIFDAHLLILEDPTVLEVSHQLIFDESLCAAAAWHGAVERAVRACEALEDPYLRARAADISDVGQRVLQLLTGTATTSLDWSEPGILIAADLMPSTTVELDRTKVLGICTVAGSTTSHAAILARSLGIPAVMGLGASLWDLENGTLIALDGQTGQVWVQPDQAQLQELQRQRDSQLGAMRVPQDLARQPAITRDGHQVKVMANIGGLTDAQRGIDNGAEGVGLLRSEFLYLQQGHPPTEEQQVEVYQAIAQTIAPHPLIIRTLDVGGDKPLPYLNLPLEANPFLGCRGIRLLFDYPELLTVQLRAILRASYGHAIKVMFPMVASVREIKAAKEILATVRTSLTQSGIPFDEAMEVGIMIEVPAAVTIADQLAAEVDFFSIGTNDLSQYLMAADRNNPKVAPLTDAFEPAVLRMIAQTVQAAHEAGIEVGVCGELASVPAAVPILIGLGVVKLSMNPPAIPAVKAAITKLTMAEAEAIASTVLKLDSAAVVREYVNAR